MKFLLDPYLWMALTVLFFTIATLIFKLDYINIYKIIKNHIGNFKNTNGKIPIMIWILYFICPLIMAISLGNIKQVETSIISNITVMLSIITAMLFTLIPMVMDFKSKIYSSIENNASRSNDLVLLTREVFDSIMFEIIVSIFILLIIFISSFAKIYNIPISILIYYLIFVFLLNLMIVLKRFYIIFKELMNN